ncbi:MAG: small multi-drug export protein [Emergencia sp.]|uniref:Small multidrug export protein n=2 Tax=Bacillota TaxID=1239 RepID=A0A845QHH0_9FIRM|nr:MULTISPECIES: small multi-drug export protein [Anaerotruncus]MCI9476600.1 small multi-drug export protein [Emergencia sp.]NCE99886.1 small multidrug export protein [Emergencia sp. 1XD21-10]MCI9639615.1 small multi-drug export protein [Emergencia sp.]NBH60117.1 small multidrug export protein [Anaerotruncus colihominis]NCF00771.1 small multidrug export protein [Anaerotruncus sp. 80]
MSFWGTHTGNLMMTMLISMVPVLELRGAIPAGVAAGLSVKEALVVSIIGNLLPVPIIILFVRKVFDWMRKKSERLDFLVCRFEEKAKKQSVMIDKYEWFGLVLLVAVPLPGTGAWTGALVAAMLNMRLKRALPAVFIGVVIAGIVVSYITYGASMLI